MFCKTDGPFYFTFSPPLPLSSPFLLYIPLWFYKRNWCPDPIRWFFWGTLVLRLPGLPAFRIKSYSLPQHLVSRFIGLLWGEQRELGLSNTTMWQLLSSMTQLPCKTGIICPIFQVGKMRFRMFSLTCTMPQTSKEWGQYSSSSLNASKVFPFSIALCCLLNQLVLCNCHVCPVCFYSERNKRLGTWYVVLFFELRTRERDS